MALVPLRIIDSPQQYAAWLFKKAPINRFKRRLGAWWQGGGAVPAELRVVQEGLLEAARISGKINLATAARLRRQQRKMRLLARQRNKSTARMIAGYGVIPPVAGTAISTATTLATSRRSKQE